MQIAPQAIMEQSVVKKTRRKRTQPGGPLEVEEEVKQLRVPSATHWLRDTEQQVFGAQS